MTLPLLTISLEAAVPLWIEHLKSLPLADVLARAPDLAQHIAEHGDKILYRYPGGVKFARLHFEATHPEQER